LAVSQAVRKINQLKHDIDKKDTPKLREMLLRCAGTALNSKLIAGQKEFFSQMVVDAVMHLDDFANLNKIGMKRVAGGSVTDSFLCTGVAFKKTFS
jgi:T-complex protein 1 subunit eta